MKTVQELPQDTFFCNCASLFARSCGDIEAKANVVPLMGQLCAI